MKKIVLSLGVLATVAVQAQNLKSIVREPSIGRIYSAKEGVPSNNNPLLLPPANNNHSSAGRAVTSTAIGVAGNLYTVLNEGTKPLFADDSIATVAFIHRGLNQANVANNKGQYLFDVSKNKGATWNNNIGPLNPLAQYVGTPSARFPQAAIFRPNNTQIADSAYLAYTGTWLDYTSTGGTGDEWSGEYRGQGRLDGNTSTFTESADIVNGGNVGVSESFKQSQNGVFWNLGLNFRTVPNSGGGNSTLRDSLLIMKGVWNSTTRSINWTTTKLAHGAVVDDVQGTGDDFTLISDFDIAFDPTGQIGWIALKGDFLADNKYTYDPVFFKTTDGGSTWSAPIYVNLTEIQQIAFDLSFAAVTTIATTTGSSDLVVDAFGNPHYLLAALGGVEDDGSGTNKYSYYPNAGVGLYDLTFDPNAGNGCNWKATFLAEITSITPGDICLDEPGGSAITADIRVNIAKSNDSKKLFFTWLDTDAITGENPDPSDNFFKNVSPNFFVKGLDLVSNKLTPTKNITDGDALFGGNRVGSYGGALFPSVSPTVFENGTTYNIPLVLTQVDYQSTTFQKFGTNPAAFYYISNVNIAASEFTDSLSDELPPVITLVGSADTVLLVGTAYVEPGATAVDCNDGQVSVTFSNNVDFNVPGDYTATYIAVDAAGNADTVTRNITVGRVPVAQFTYTTQTVPNGVRLNFSDRSLFAPTSWAWSFGAGASPAASNSKNPSATYFTFGQKCITLTATNSFGSDDTTVCVTVSSIDEAVFYESLSVYPNPSNGTFNVSIAGVDNEEINVTVVNMLGEAVLPVSKTLVSGKGFLTIDASSLAAGSYFVKLSASKASAVRPITIVK